MERSRRVLRTAHGDESSTAVVSRRSGEMHRCGVLLREIALPPRRRITGPHSSGLPTLYTLDDDEATSVVAGITSSHDDRGVIIQSGVEMALRGHTAVMALFTMPCNTRVYSSAFFIAS
jgi:hypothetical protein